MNRPLQLLKAHRVGIWCRRAAWVILIIGLIRVALVIYSIFSENNFPVSIPVPQELISIAAELTSLVDVLFYFFILYAAAVVIEHLTGSTSSTKEDELDLEVVDLEEEAPEQLHK